MRVIEEVSDNEQDLLRQSNTKGTYLMKFLITEINDQLLKTVCLLDFEAKDIEQSKHLPAAKRPHL